MTDINALLANSREIDERLKKSKQPEPVSVAEQDAVIVDHECRIEELERAVSELIAARQTPRRGRPRKSNGE